MHISQTLVLVFLLCWLVVGCHQPALFPVTEAVVVAPTIAPTVTPPPHAYSSILVPTPTAAVLPTITPAQPMTTVVKSDFMDGTTVEEMSWQGDVLITNAAPDMRSNRVKFTPETVLWQRDRVELTALQVGAEISVFGLDGGDMVDADYMVMLDEPTQDFVKEGVYTQAHVGIGKITAIIPTPDGWLITVVHNGDSWTIRTTPVTRLFHQHRVMLAALEPGSDLLYQGRLLQHGNAMLTEVTKAAVMYVPSQYQPEQFPLICTITNEIAHCRDEYLGIEFDHPASWGESIGTLGRSRYVGFSYEYRFENPGVIAGGRSHHFTEPRDGFFTDFGGTDGRPLTERCLAPDVMLCETIQPGVELTIRRSSGEALCRPGPGMIGRPTVFITVDLPDHTRINGLLFATGFLSTALTEELAPLEPQPYPAQSAPINCDEDSLLRYEERMQRLAQQIRDNSLDAETQANLQTLRNMAASFRGQALPDQ